MKAITEELCGHSFSASSISAMNQRLDASLAQFAGRPLAEAFPYLILDARYERVREAGVITSQAVLIAIGIDWDGRRQVLAVELANRESRSSWRDFLLGLKARGLHGVEFVVADDHAGLRAALREVLAEAAYQRCYVHFLRNALDYVPRRVTGRQVGTKGWSFPIEQRDAPLSDLNEPPHPNHDQFAELDAHNSKTARAERLRAPQARAGTIRKGNSESAKLTIYFH